MNKITEVSLDFEKTEPETLAQLNQDVLKELDPLVKRFHEDVAALATKNNLKLNTRVFFSVE